MSIYDCLDGLDYEQLELIAKRASEKARKIQGGKVHRVYFVDDKEEYYLEEDIEQAYQKAREYLEEQISQGKKHIEITLACIGVYEDELADYGLAVKND